MKTLRDIGLAVASGVLTALAFPKFRLSFLAWISLIPLLFVIVRSRPWRAFWMGLTAGVSFYGLLIYWIPDVPAHYGGLSFGLSLLIDLVLVLTLALYWALFSLILAKIFRHWSAAAFILAPLIWVAQEYALTHVLTGFPWGLLGYTQQANLWLIQVAALTGVYGVSWVLLFFQGSFVFSMRSKKRLPFFIGLGVLTAFHVGGALALGRPEAKPESFRAAVIQGNVSSDIAWDQVSASEVLDVFKQHLDMTRQAASEGAQLIVWPEFSTPMCFSCDDPLYVRFKGELLAFVRKTGKTLLIGTTEVSATADKTEYFNSALALQPDQTWTEYHKMHLVPFGEYTPYPSVFGFVQGMTQAIGEITPGVEHTLHSLGDLRFGSPICYEIIFPNLVRGFVKGGAHFLVTITNDGWYGPTSAPYQHFAMAVFRAVENRRFLLRAATTGVSGIVDPWGRVRQRSEIMTRTFLADTVTPSSGLTFYARFGDLFSLFCLTLTLVFFILSFFLGRHGQQGQKTRQRIY